ncbi:MAG: hypothetical protein M3R51_00330 [Candidatus Eremiobacteraeota bacterium]|nr:hypothetical protein [Candidatus Eremiobacteraeota bacterium]
MIARGRVSGVRAGLLDVTMPGACVGQGVRVDATPPRSGTVCAVAAGHAYVAVHGDVEGLACGARVDSDPTVLKLPLGTCALGRAFDATGTPLDGRRPIRGTTVLIAEPAPMPEDRRPVRKPLWTGIKAIDALLTIGVGARIGLFGSPGVGKTTLLESIVGGVRADAVVIGLIGERGREAQQWIASCNRRTTVICATSDRPPSERVRAAAVTVAQARALARRGLNVLIVLDSLARYAAALRELAIAGGEAAGRGGYPPSVFAGVAQLVERCSAGPAGSVSLLATVLDDGDDRDPVSDAARSLLDGHIALSSRLARAGRFPAIDVPSSASRTMAAVAHPAHLRSASAVRAALALLERTDDARSIGIETTDAATLRAVAAEHAIESLLRQSAAGVDPQTSLRSLAAIADTLAEPYGYSE